ncbi:MAG: EpsG family protein [Bacteroidales bacterium]|nr:EpsG family protein [Bacteroidales bacterium]
MGQYGELVQKRSFWSFEIVFMLLFFALMFGMRYDVGTDHLGYLFSYIEGSVGEDLRMEPLFRWISKICYDLNIHPIIYFAIWAFIQITFFLLAFKNERYLFPLLITFLFFNLSFTFWMNGIRQALAMCIWLYSITFIVEKKFWHYIIGGIIAFLFHRSALILFVFYPLLRNGKDYFKSIPLQLILFASVFIIKNVFEVFILQFELIIEQFQTILGGESELYRDYTMDNMLDELNREVGGTGLAYMFRILVWIIIILYSRKLKSYYNSKKFNIIYFFFFFGLLTQYIFPEGIIILARPFCYFPVFQTIMLAYFVYYLFRSNSFRFNRLLAYALIIAFIGVFYLNMLGATERSSILFQFYFQKM